MTDDPRVELIGLTRDAIRAALEGAGMDARQAKLRSKQLWHWIYNRGVTDFSLMTDIAKAQQPWLAERFKITRPKVVEAQVSSARGQGRCRVARSGSRRRTPGRFCVRGGRGHLQSDAPAEGAPGP